MLTVNEGEYLSQEFEGYLKPKGVHHELTVPHYLEQNGGLERMNRTPMKTAQSMIAHAGLPLIATGHVETEAYLGNQQLLTRR